MRIKTNEFKVGEWVVQCQRGIRLELGRVKSINSKFVFVVFHCDTNWNNFTDYTGQACHPSQLEVVESLSGEE